jgi:Domain of unknown function (DUF4936)
VDRQLFVYWRVAPAALPAALAAVRQAQARLADGWPGLVARVYERCDPAPEATVMETYEAPGGLDAAAQARIEAALAPALTALPAGPRHVEAFRPR